MPLFIVGFARSGTTLCQNLVSQRLVIPTLPETHFFEFLEQYEPSGGHIAPEAARRFLDDLSRFVDLPDTRFPALLAEPSVPIRALFLRVVGHLIGSHQLASQGLWLEKTPGHAEHMERIHQMFPKARFICMVRNPIGAFASRRELMEPGKGWGEEWKPIEAFCAQWADHIAGVRAFAERHPGLLMTIRLEDLASDPERELARVREFVGPAYGNGVKAPVPSTIIQPFETWKRDALQPADPKIAERAGRATLDAYETWRVCTLLRDLMASFDYPTDAEAPEMDGLHQRLVTSLDWYRDAMARRDALMDVKTARIRSLLNERAGAGEGDGSPPPRPRRFKKPGVGRGADTPSRIEGGVASDAREGGGEGEVEVAAGVDASAAAEVATPPMPARQTARRGGRAKGEGGGAREGARGPRTGPKPEADD